MGAVELVVKGMRGGKREAFSTASGPVRRRRIVHKSTVPILVSVRQLETPWGHQARGRARVFVRLFIEPEQSPGPFTEPDLARMG